MYLKTRGRRSETAATARFFHTFLRRGPKDVARQLTGLQRTEAAYVSAYGPSAWANRVSALQP
jgi:hypothetical protein